MEKQKWDEKVAKAMEKKKQDAEYAAMSKDRGRYSWSAQHPAYAGWMKKIKLFPAPHVEIRIHVSEEMERDYAECQKMMKRGEDYDCDRCSWANVSIYGTGACELKGLKEQLGGISGETDGKER